MLVREVMTTEPVVVSATTSVDDVVRLLAENSVTTLPVVDEGGRVVGIVSEADVLPRLLLHDPRAHHLRVPSGVTDLPQSVYELMTPSPHVVRPDEDVRDLAATMVRHGWKSVPVVSGGRIVGIVSRSDVVRALARPDAWIRRDLRSVLTELGYDRWGVEVSAGVARISGPLSVVDREVAEAAGSCVVGVRRVHVVGASGGDRGATAAEGPTLTPSPAPPRRPYLDADGGAP